MRNLCCFGYRNRRRISNSIRNNASNRTDCFSSCNSPLCHESVLCQCCALCCNTCSHRTLCCQTSDLNCAFYHRTGCVYSTFNNSSCSFCDLCSTFSDGFSKACCPGIFRCLGSFFCFFFRTYSGIHFFPDSGAVSFLRNSVNAYLFVNFRFNICFGLFACILLLAILFLFGTYINQLYTFCIVHVTEDMTAAFLDYYPGFP